MKTNYKQSQAAPHAKPIFTVSRNDSTLYVLPAYLAGAVMIRLDCSILQMEIRLKNYAAKLKMTD